ncbi:MAG: ferrous iron transport protein B [Candidatus Sedimenticola endophacoides]|uniref:Ferrous iron transport protein B n=1 Tax=Candidatus Sedimenticola endophacoides TaxID=2548426 RepID=A0A6N4DPQ6_9GAMM|nr:MAG: ferrous iron transport protein B [Candidatus Sedimenticola endophacoides]OQX36058.1 MAG: ferrous iron transport protein B [Candidatus Sedimenticola endophacoides]OQX40084.1 MAG: ferrous iron transport protein B [Candidatus Sedimenticola endophacoides]PUD99589.1 MAG: ferrous iron transporter B [Candidatus Sedimenticola endophacoides]PUD99821.1 MAG: ferrous iron transporter B [Candidatus Sedimenticola endophacoides]
MLTIALGGNPNCGKSALFNAFTGIRQKTGNWPGVTVDRKEGRFNLDGTDITVVDLPGIYSLDASSLDEQVTRDYLLSREAGLIVNVLDASNLERNLYFTIQLREMGIPMVIALNMMDVARKRGILVDTDQLARELGCPVVPVVAVSGEGLGELRQRIREVAAQGQETRFEVAHEDSVEQAMADLAPQLTGKSDQANLRWLGLKLLEGDQYALSLADAPLRQRVAHWRQVIADRAGEEVDIHIADARYSHAHAITQRVLREHGRLDKTASDQIDRIILHRLAGIPIFLLVMYLMFMFTINLGGAFIDFFDIAVGALAVDGLGHWLRGLGSPEWLTLLLAEGVGGGIQVVSTFIPIIACLYLFLSVLEDTGYMARAAFVMDRAMRAVGLPGKAFVPLIVGFGCNVPAVMATRTLENQRERKLTILMNPFMSCGARLPVYALFAAAFFPANGQNLVFLLYLIGIAVAVLTGLIMRRTLLSGDSTGFMMELPPYHLPTLKGVALRTWDRVKLFIKDAGKVIVVMVLIINTLNSIGTDGSFGNNDSEHSVLSAAAKVLTPLLAPIGIKEENWPATIGIFTGVLAKEVVVGTLDTLYTQLAVQDAGGARAEQPFDLVASLRQALASIGENLSALRETLLDPLSMNLGAIDDPQAAARAQQVNSGTFGAMAARFDGQAGAFAYLLFILLYAPCVATMGAIRREAGGAWALFVVAWTTGVAYATATIYYQAASYAAHPRAATLWILAMTLAVAAVIVGLRLWSRRGARAGNGA